MIATALNLNLKAKHERTEKSHFIYSKAESRDSSFRELFREGEKERLKLGIYIGGGPWMVVRLLRFSSVTSPAHAFLESYFTSGFGEEEEVENIQNETSNGDRKSHRNEIMTNKSIKKSRLISTKFTYQRREKERELNGRKESH